jgi:DNA-binding NarL/FixJ family response regulator
MSIRVLIADDQALVRAGFAKLLDTEPGIDVIAEAADGREAIELAKRKRPDVVLMDVRMPGVDGLQATRSVLADSSGATRVLILTTFDLDEYVYDALKAGASGFLLKDSPPDELIGAIHVVADGNALIAPSITRRLIAEFAKRPTPRAQADGVLAGVTPRELDVLRLVARGLNNAEIATELVVSEATIKTHVGSLLFKLDLRDRVQAVVLAYESGLIQPGQTATAGEH